MNYWWVNHNQTHKHELGRDYIWAPKRNKLNRRSQFYDNLTRVQKNDIVISYARSAIMAIGIALQSAKDSPRPSEFGATGDQWDKDGWLVKVDWIILDTPFSPKDYIDEIAPLLPKKYSPISSNGNGLQGAYLAEISSTLGKFILNKSGIHELITNQLEISTIEQSEEHIENEINNLEIPETETEQLVKSRRGHGLFKKRVQEIEHKCRITGISDKRFLIASHIKPWRDSNNKERLDGNNGLLLSPHVDNLFDSGWISFADNGDLIIANNTIRNILKFWNIDPATNVGQFNTDQKKYLEYHRKIILKKE